MYTTHARARACIYIHVLTRAKILNGSCTYGPQKRDCFKPRRTRVLTFIGLFESRDRSSIVSKLIVYIAKLTKIIERD